MSLSTVNKQVTECKNIKPARIDNSGRGNAKDKNGNIISNY